MTLAPRADDGPPIILLVDDNLPERRIAEMRLVTAGYSVRSVAGGREALACFEKEPIELILLDVDMPEMDGFATLDALRRTERGRELPIVFLTGMDDLSTHERALRAGIDDYLVKPLRGTELLIRVRSLLRLGRTSAALRASHALISAQRDELLRGRDLRRQLSTFLVHDLKSPLAMIMAATKLVQRNTDGASAEKLQMVQRAATNMLRMVRNLLDIARSEDGRLLTQPSDCHLRDLLEELVASHRGVQGEWHASIRFEVHYLLAEPCARVDGELLRRVLENLLDNALRYSPADGVIALEARRVHDELELVVRDQGPGIPERQRERIFDMYVQLDEDSPRRMGHGLGLVFARIAVEAHGGSLLVDDAPGGGAAFHVRLPYQPPSVVGQ